MDDEISLTFTVPVDDDGFLRRECPTCEREFKWFAHEEGSDEAEPAEQYFCPLCGVAADIQSWWTQAQLDYAQGVAAPEADRVVQDAVADSFKGIKGATFRADRNFSMDIPTPEPLIEPNDMVIVEPPCHPNEPLKVPEDFLARVHCLICGEPFAVV